MAKNDELDLSQIDDDSPDAPSQLRQFAERQAKKGARVDVLEKEVALLRAGIDTSTKLGRAFLQTMESDLTDPAAILAEAMDFSPSIIRGGTAASTTTATDAQTGQTGTQVAEAPTDTGSAERQALSDGAQPSGAAKPDIRAASLEAARNAIDQGSSQEQALGAFVAVRSAGVHSGEMSALGADGRPYTPQR